MQLEDRPGQPDPNLPVSRFERLQLDLQSDYDQWRKNISRSLRCADNKRAGLPRIKHATDTTFRCMETVWPNPSQFSADIDVNINLAPGEKEINRTITIETGGKRSAKKK